MRWFGILFLCLSELCWGLDSIDISAIDDGASIYDDAEHIHNPWEPGTLREAIEISDTNGFKPMAWSWGAQHHWLKLRVYNPRKSESEIFIRIKGTFLRTPTVYERNGNQYTKLNTPIFKDHFKPVLKLMVKDGVREYLVKIQGSISDLRLYKSETAVRSELKTLSFVMNLGLGFILILFIKCVVLAKVNKDLIFLLIGLAGISNASLMLAIEGVLTSQFLSFEATILFFYFCFLVADTRRTFLVVKRDNVNLTKGVFIYGFISFIPPFVAMYDFSFGWWYLLIPLVLSVLFLFIAFEHRNVPPALYFTLAFFGVSVFVFYFLSFELTLLISYPLFLIGEIVHLNVKMSNKIDEKNKELVEMNKLKDEFLANTSHELRTPLNGILGFAGLIRKGFYSSNPAKLDNQVAQIEALALSLKSQVNTILDVSKSKVDGLKIQNSQISLDELVEESKLLAEGLVVARPGRTFTCNKNWSNEEKLLFISDHEKLSTIVKNLLGNAFKFADPNRDNHVTLNFDYSEARLCVEVGDTGIGISDGNLAIIFEEFRQVSGNSNRSYEGTGLGLTMVKQLTDLFEGNIKVDSEIDKGTKISVTVPEQSEVHLTADIRQKSIPVVFKGNNYLGMKPNHDEKKGYKILVVDDNPINCEVLQDILQSSGYNVRVALGGQASLRILKEEKVDLILLDLMMPDVSGEDVILHCKQDEQLRNIPIIVITARASQDDRLSVLDTGADEYLAKPIISDEIILRVKNTTARLDLLNEKLEKSELKGQLSAARLVQTALIPDERETDLAGFSIEQHFESADEAGGDWYQYHHDEANKRLYVFIADVTGHGVSASILTGLTYGAIHGLFAEIENWTEQPSMEVMLNKITCTVDRTISMISGKTNRSMTALFVGFDLESGDGLIVSAGHPWPFIMKDGSFESLVTKGKMLGYGIAKENKPTPFRLDEGEILFLYTDGLIENQGPDGECLRPRNLQRILNDNLSKPGIKAKLLNQCSLIWQEQPPGDDCTFIVIKRVIPYSGKNVA